jgi:protein-L-isoaspartate(D-aspartate) O-methyltransferase
MPPRQSRLGAIGHGPRGQELAERLCRHIHTWDNDRDAQPTITARRHGTAPHDLAATTITKEHSSITVTY